MCGWPRRGPNPPSYLSRSIRVLNSSFRVDVVLTLTRSLSHDLTANSKQNEYRIVSSLGSFRSNVRRNANQNSIPTPRDNSKTGQLPVSQSFLRSSFARWRLPIVDPFRRAHKVYFMPSSMKMVSLHGTIAYNWIFTTGVVSLNSLQFSR